MAGCIHRHYWDFTVVDDVVTLVDEGGSPLITGLDVSRNDGPTVLGRKTKLRAAVGRDSHEATITRDFGDGTSGEGRVVDHTYPAAGNLIAQVMASSFGNVFTAPSTVVVIPDAKRDSDNF